MSSKGHDHLGLKELLNDFGRKKSKIYSIMISTKSDKIKASLFPKKWGKDYKDK